MKIGEIEARSGASRHTLRYYEQIGLISSLRRTNNYRVYTEQTLQDLDFIQRAQSMGFSLGEIGEILDAQRNKQIDCAEGAKLIEKRWPKSNRKSPTSRASIGIWMKSVQSSKPVLPSNLRCSG